MFAVGKKVSFSVVIALLLGWGVFSLLFIQSSSILMQSQVYDIDHSAPLPAGVRLNFQVDKKIYRAGDTVLLSLRNDSRLAIWLSEHANGCSGSWWRVEVLGTDGEKWNPVALTKETCSTKQFGLVKFQRHTLQNAEWLSLVPANQLGDIVVPTQVGTYRITVPYLKGGGVKEADWSAEPSRVVSTPSFTIQ